MGYKKMVTLACDGPCGKALEDTETTPYEWWKIETRQKQHLKEGEKGQRFPVAYLCPGCMVTFERIMRTNGFAFSKGVE